MTRSTVTLIALFLIATPNPAFGTESIGAESGWEVLFDGSGTDHWRGYRQDGFPTAGWSIEGDTLRVHHGGGGGDIITRKKYSDFELELEWKVAPKANSGVMFHVSEEGKATYHSGPEYQILDDPGYGPDYRAVRSAGALYALVPPVGKVLRPTGDFNHTRIVIKDSKLEHWLNGVRVLTTRLKDETWKNTVAQTKFKEWPLFGTKHEGHIALQDHGNDVWFRNVRIRDLSDWDTLFDGSGVEHFRGFKQDGFPDKGWSVEGDALRVHQGGGGGDIITRDQYSEFDMELEWKVAAKANSGIMFHVSEEGGATYHSGPEYQILDDGGWGYGAEDPHSSGALYALVPPKGKVLRPVGEFNHTRIVIQDDFLEHWLNGVQVLTCRLKDQAWKDLVAQTKFKQWPLFGTKHEGHIAFQDHGNDVWFRSIRIRDLSDGDEPEDEAEETASIGWENLFDGSGVEHFRGFRRDGFPNKGWSVEGETLRVHAGGGGGDIITRKQYGDFEFELEWKVSAKANSGIMFHVSEKGSATYHSGPEYQILDDAGHGLEPDNLHSAGALYGLVAPQGKVLKPTGEFNHTRIVVKDDILEHWLNGKRLLSYRLKDARFAKRVAETKFKQWDLFGTQRKGHIAIQDHGNDVWFRKIRIRDLSSTAEDSLESVSLFNGKDLNGWTHHLRGDGSMGDVWNVENGVLICKGKPAGYIRTEKDFKNFVLKLQWRFDPVTKKPGNSGVLFRQIGPDKVWPRSIEAQLQSGNAGDFWNIDKFPMITASDRTKGRNTKKLFFNERPIGEWNDYEIIANGGDIVLKVNGEILNTAKDAMEVAGKICLQSEGVPIHFRNIRVIPLN